MAVERPKVTVGMAVYGGERYIAEAIESIRRQDFPGWELLLVNDSTPDNSVEIIESIDEPRMRLVHNATNEGLVSVRNRILIEAKGEYVAWLDQDDLAAPHRLSTQVAYLDQNPHVSACGSTTKMLIHEASGSTSVATSRLPLRHRDIRAAIPFLNPMACNTVTMRTRDFVEAELEFRPAFGNSLDYDLWSRASDRLLFRNLSEPLGAYRIHQSQTSRGDALAVMRDNALQVQAELLERALGITSTEGDRALHRSATIAPLAIPDRDHMRRVAGWFARLQRANHETHAFDRRSFEAALARQWTTVTLASRRTLGASAAAQEGIRGAHTIGISPVAAARSSASGLRRRQAAGRVGSARSS